MKPDGRNGRFDLFQLSAQPESEQLQHEQCAYRSGSEYSCTHVRVLGSKQIATRCMSPCADSLAFTIYVMLGGSPKSPTSLEWPVPGPSSSTGANGVSAQARESADVVRSH
jgi:hypothetical protein